VALAEVGDAEQFTEGGAGHAQRARKGTFEGAFILFGACRYTDHHLE